MAGVKQSGHSAILIVKQYKLPEKAERAMPGTTVILLLRIYPIILIMLKYVSVNT